MKTPGLIVNEFVPNHVDKVSNFDDWYDLPETPQCVESEKSKMPRVDVQLDFGHDRVMRLIFDLHQDEWHPFMRPYRFETLLTAIESSNGWRQLENRLMNGQEKALINAILAERLMWLQNCGFLHQMHGKWMFNSRQYCESKGLFYDLKREKAEAEDE